MMLKRFQLAGHHPYILIGGGTGVIGDPSGRKTERQLQTVEQIGENAKKLKTQFLRLSEKTPILPLSTTMIGSLNWIFSASCAITANCSASMLCWLRMWWPVAWKRGFLYGIFLPDFTVCRLSSSLKRTGCADTKSAVPISGEILRPVST